MRNLRTTNLSISPARPWTFRIAMLACIILTALSGATLQAQFVYVDAYDFDCSVGCYPSDVGQLTRWSDGRLYGSTLQGAGSSYDGALFSFNPSSDAVKLEWQFQDNATGYYPNAALSLGSDGNFYGTTTQGEASVFRYTPPGTLTVIHNFTGAEGTAVTAPTQARDGNFYGVTTSGTTYRITYPGGVYQPLSGIVPLAGSIGFPLVASLDGNLYGTSGDFLNYGIIFRLTTAGKVDVIHNFSGPDGSAPDGVTLAADGNLYGTTGVGGANGTGVVFKFTLPGHKLTVLYSFSSLQGSGQNPDGADPSNGLLAASDGYLYGATSVGGNNTCGTLFRISTSGSFTKLAEFPNFNCVMYGPNTPYAALTENTDGTLYGLLSLAGGRGTLYALVPSSPPHNIIIAGPIWVKPGVPVQILGDNLSEAVSVTFGGVEGTFQPGSNTFLNSIAPNDAVDGPIVVTLTNPAGQVQLQSQHNVHILPLINNLDPPSGPVGTTVNVVGGGFIGTNKVTFGGVKVTSFRVVTPALIQAVVPAGAKTGKVAVVTPNGTAASNVKFTVK